MNKKTPYFGIGVFFLWEKGCISIILSIFAYKIKQKLRFRKWKK